MKEVQIGSYILKEDVLKLGKENWNKFREWLKEQGYNVDPQFGRYEGCNLNHNDFIFIDEDAYLVWDSSLHLPGCEYKLTAQDILSIVNQKQETKKMKPTDEVTLTTTYGELAKVYAVLSKTNGATRGECLWVKLHELFNEKYDKGGWEIIKNKIGTNIINYNSMQLEWEEFLFTPEETEQQKKIKELEETIKLAQIQILQLKKME